MGAQSSKIADFGRTKCSEAESLHFLSPCGTPELNSLSNDKNRVDFKPCKGTDQSDHSGDHTVHSSVLRLTKCSEAESLRFLSSR